MQIYILAIATLITAIVAWTAYQQHRLARDKFKLDLFEKRFLVYKGVQRFLTHILQEGGFEIDKLYEFRRDTQDAIFLFDDEITEYLRSIDHKALDMRTKAKQYEHIPAGDERSRLCQEESKLLKELIDELPLLKDVFAPYMKFSKWK